MFEIDSDDMISNASERWKKRDLAKLALWLVVLFHVALAALMVI